MELYEHQSKIVSSIFEKLNELDSVLVQSATGSGKTVIMAYFIKKYIELNPHNKIVISVHREELVSQTSMTLARFGVLNTTITSKTKKNDISLSNIYVGMCQTIWARQISIDADLHIIDEAHEQIHLKTFDLFPNAKRLGFTATPIINGTRTYFKCNYCAKKYEERVICCYNEHIEKWTAPIVMAEQYNDIILGPNIKYLIEQGFLVDELVFSYNYYSELEDIDDENEIANESVKHDEQVLKEYTEKAEGKKTMIFTASTKQNTSLVNVFEEAGYKIKSYDSVNNKSAERKDIVKWFSDTDGAILVSTGTFTTGFDNREVECIIVNRPTQSLSLWHQIIGRGARTSNLIFKDIFIVIDLGGNTVRLGKWSDIVNWKKIFFEGNKKPKKKKEVLIQCDKCAYNWIGVQGDVCPDCGHENIPIIEIRNRTEKDNDLQKLQISTVSENAIPLPNPVKIAEFVKRTSNSKKDFFRIIIDRYVDLWKYNNVTKKIYLQRIENETLIPKIRDYVQNMYRYSRGIPEGANRTYNYLIEKIKEKLSKCYK